MLKNKKAAAVIILAVSLVTHFVFFGQPNQAVFDEVHFGKFVSGYLAGQYFFDIHPPLGKLMLNGVAKLSGFGPEFWFNNIGDVFPNKHYLLLRFFPTLAGALLPLVVFWLAQELKISLWPSLVIGLLTALESALIIQSRFILLDSFLLLFGFLALLAYLKYRHNFSQKHLWLAGIFGALAGSIKWTGLSFLGLIIISEIIRLAPSFFSTQGWKESVRAGLKHLLALVAIPFLIYFAVFAVHFKLLPRSGPGDAFMTPAFQKTLAGSRYQSELALKPTNLWQKFVELNAQMYKSNQHLNAGHPYGSSWYTWPLMTRPIYFWNKGEDRKIYLLGNPAVWWVSTVAIILLIIHWSFNFFQRKSGSFSVNWFLGGYFLNLLPFIGVKRVMFLYHYFPALIFTLLALGYLLDQAHNKKTVGGLLLGLAAFFFLYFAPLTYGLPVTTKELAGFFWLNSWR